MQERMQELGGQMQILRNGPGFMVEFRLPRRL
jgi:signal transduction histidine kinase